MTNQSHTQESEFETINLVSQANNATKTNGLNGASKHPNEPDHKPLYPKGATHG